MGITVFPLLPLSRYGHVGLIYQSVIEQYKTDVPIDRIKVVLAFSKGDADKPVILIAAVIFQKCSRPISGIRIDHISAMRKKMLNQFDATVILALWFIAVDLLNSGKLQTFIRSQLPLIVNLSNLIAPPSEWIVIKLVYRPS